MLGVKTGTLGKWRFLGKGPRGWIRLSETLVSYPAGEVAAWKAERAAAPSPGFRGTKPAPTVAQDGRSSHG